MATSKQKVAWVAIGLLLVVLSATVLWQVQAISRLQDVTSQSIDALEQQVRADIWERQTQEWHRMAQEWEREAQEKMWKH